MDAQYFSVDQSPKWQIVKSIVEILPRSGAAILLDDFVIEAINGGYLSGLMIASEQDDVFGVFQLVAK